MVSLRFLSLTCILLLAACTSHQQRPAPSRDAWKLEGKLAIVSTNQSQQANVRWVSQDGDYDILLFGPLGQGKIHIRKQGDKIELTDGKDKVDAGSPEELLYKTTGLTLPVSLLQYWVIGRPAPDIPFSYKHQSAYGQLTGFVQAGWQVHFDEYITHFPEKIKMHNADGIKLTLVVKKWSRP